MYTQVNVFSQKELEFLDTIDAAITRRYRLNEALMELDGNDLKSGQFKEEVSVMEKNLKEIMERMSERNHSEEHFLEHYEEWRKIREKCIDKLKQIAKSLHRDRHVANMAKLCGLCLSIGGGISLIASGGIPVCPSSTCVVGAGLTATETSIVLGASITESVRLVRKINKAKRLIEKDKAYFKDIQEWLNHANELQESLISVLDIDVLKAISADVKKIVQTATKIKDEYKRLKFIEKKVNTIFSQFLDDTHVPVTEIVMIPRILITVILLLCKTENRLVFDFASVSLKSVVVVGMLAENSLQAILSSSSKLSVSSLQVLKLATGLIGITLDAVAIARTCVDIHRKSRSPEAEKITTAAANYAKEVEVLDDLYQQLSKETESTQV